MKLYDFDGCAVGLKSTSGVPIRKPWTVATNHEKLGTRLSQFRCKCTMKHYPGRGEDLKRTEEYTFRMTDAISIKCYENIILQPVLLKTFVFAVPSLPRSSLPPWRSCRISSSPTPLRSFQRLQRGLRSGRRRSSNSDPHVRRSPGMTLWLLCCNTMDTACLGRTWLLRPSARVICQLG